MKSENLDLDDLLKKAIHYLSTKEILPHNYPFIYNTGLVHQKPNATEWTLLELRVFNSIYLILLYGYSKNKKLAYEPSYFELPMEIELTPWMKARLDDMHLVHADLFKVTYPAFAELVFLMIQRILDYPNSEEAKYKEYIQDMALHFALVHAVDDYLTALNARSIHPAGLHNFESSSTEGLNFRKTFYVKYVDCAEHDRINLINPHVFAFYTSPTREVQMRGSPPTTRLEQFYTRVAGELYAVKRDKVIKFELMGNVTDSTHLCFAVFYEITDIGDKTDMPTYQVVAHGSIPLNTFTDSTSIEMRTTAVNGTFYVENGKVKTPYKTYLDCRLFVSPTEKFNGSCAAGPITRSEAAACNEFFTEVYKSVKNIDRLSQSIVYQCLPQFIPPIHLLSHIELPSFPLDLLTTCKLRTMRAYGFSNEKAFQDVFAAALRGDRVKFLLAREMFVSMFNWGTDFLYLNDKMYGKAADYYCNAWATQSGDCEDMAIMAYQTLTVMKRSIANTNDSPLMEFLKAYTPTMCVVSVNGRKNMFASTMLHMICLMIPSVDMLACVNQMNKRAHSALRPMILDGTVRTFNIRAREYNQHGRELGVDAYLKMHGELAPQLKIFKMKEVDTDSCETDICDRYGSFLSICCSEKECENTYMRFNKDHGQLDAFGVDYNLIMDWEEGTFELGTLTNLLPAVTKQMSHEMDNMARFVAPIPEFVRNIDSPTPIFDQNTHYETLYNYMLQHKPRKSPATAVAATTIVLRRVDVTESNWKQAREEFDMIVKFCDQDKENRYRVKGVERYNFLFSESTIDVVISFDIV